MGGPVAADEAAFPKRLPNGLGCSFAGGVAAVTSTDGAVFSLPASFSLPNLIGEPAFQVLSDAATPKVLALPNAEPNGFADLVSVLVEGCGVLGLEPKSPSCGMGPSLKLPKAGVEEAGVGVK